MEIETRNYAALNEPNQVGNYIIIKQPTPEVVALLKALHSFRYTDERVSFKLICKGTEWNGDPFASIGWKLTFPERLPEDKEVEELLRKWYAKL